MADIADGTASLVRGPALERTFREIALGDVLENTWRVTSKLGEGGMGTVLLATDLVLERRVAIKVLAPHLAGQPEAVARFELEAKLTAQLDHPNIVPVHAVGRFYERPFIVMKHLEGSPLSALIERQPGPWPWAQVRALAEAIVSGLTYLHGRGLVHRDVKPSNIFVGPDGHVTLLDFGLIKYASTDHTSPGQLVGTLRFMAPEQVTQASTIDARTDVYALGVVLYTLLVGRTPFSGDDLQVVREKLTRDPPPAATLNPSLSRPASEALAKAMHRSPEHRLASVSALFEALDAAASAPSVRPQRRLAVGVGVIAAVSLIIAVPLLRRPSSHIEQAAAPTAPDAGQQPPPAEVSATPPPAAPLPTPEPPRAPPSTPAPSTPMTRKARPVLTPVSIISLVEGKASFADVSVDGKPQGETPTRVELAPGRHEVALSRPGFRDTSTTITVVAGRPERVVLELKR